MLWCQRWWERWPIYCCSCNMHLLNGCPSKSLPAYLPNTNLMAKVVGGFHAASEFLSLLNVAHKCCGALWRFCAAEHVQLILSCTRTNTRTGPSHQLEITNIHTGCIYKENFVDVDDVEVNIPNGPDKAAPIHPSFHPSAPNSQTWLLSKAHGR